MIAFLNPLNFTFLPRVTLVLVFLFIILILVTFTLKIFSIFDLRFFLFALDGTLKIIYFNTIIVHSPSFSELGNNKIGSKL